MAKIQEVTDAVFDVLDTINEMLPKDRKIVKSMETVLIGWDSALDSLSITMLIVAMEDKIKKDFDKTIQLTNALTTYSEDGKIKNVSFLVNYILATLGE